MGRVGCSTGRVINGRLGTRRHLLPLHQRSFSLDTNLILTLVYASHRFTGSPHRQLNVTSHTKKVKYVNLPREVTSVRSSDC